MITTKGLHIGYTSTLLEVEDLNLTAGLHILIGKNGSGKSTFLKTLSGQLNPIQGSLALSDQDLKSLSKSEIPKTIAFVGSHFPQVDFLKVDDFIALGRSPFTNFFGRRHPADDSIMVRAIEVLRIEHLQSRFTSELSDGERQLVAIAKALTQETPIIALDEPTAFLDYSNKKLVLDNLVKIGSEFNKCIVLSSHDLDLSLEANCPFLVIEDRMIRFIEAGLSKNELIRLAFGD